MDVEGIMKVMIEYIFFLSLAGLIWVCKGCFSVLVLGLGAIHMIFFVFCFLSVLFSFRLKKGCLSDRKSSEPGCVASS